MTTGSLWGTLTYAYVKGVDAVVINNMYAVQGELSWDASRTGDCTITTAAACFRAKITGGRVADYTKIHGYELTIGEMDGDSQAFGSGIVMQDDSGMSGTSTLTTGLNLLIGCATGISITGTCSTAGILLGTTNKLSFHDAGMYMYASADGHLEIVSDDTLRLTAPGHGSIQFGGEPDWATGSTGHLIDGSGWDWCTATVAYVTSGTLDTACAAAYHSMCVKQATHTTASSFFGTWTELGLIADCVLTGAANVAAVWGQTEGAGALTSPDSGDFVTGAYFNVKTAGLLTLTDGSSVNGVRVKGEVHSITGTGIFAAFECVATTTDWAYGLKISNATTGVDIGTCTTGINITGTVTTGIDFTSTTITPDANRTNSAIAIGDRLGAKTITMSAATLHLDPIQINLNIAGTNPTDGTTINGIYQKITHTAAHMAGLRLKCSDWNIIVENNIKDVYCMQGEVDFTTDAVTVGGEAAVLGLVMNCASATTGNIRGIVLSMQGAGMPETTNSIGIELRSTGTTLGEGIRIAGTPLPTVGIVFGNPLGASGEGNEAPATAFFFPAGPSADQGPVRNTAATGDGDGSIQIKIGSGTKYLQYWDTAS